MNRNNKLLITLLALLLNFSLFAQEEFPDDTQDVPSAPIDSFLPFLGIAGIILVFYYLNNKRVKL